MNPAEITPKLAAMMNVADRKALGVLTPDECRVKHEAKEGFIGLRFGRLIVKRFVETRHYACDGGNYFKHENRWLCHCDCGKNKILFQQYLVSKGTQSCGCLAKERAAQCQTNDLLNKRFGRLVVIEKTIKRHNGCVIWRCRCDCGKEREIMSASLTAGHSNSCGCLRKELMGKRYRGVYGPKHATWNPKLTNEDRTDRRDLPQHLRFRKGIVKRDGFTCRGCGVRGKQFIVHHIVPWSKSREKRFDPDNCLTLCRKCHKEYHTKGNPKCILAPMPSQKA